MDQRVNIPQVMVPKVSTMYICESVFLGRDRHSAECDCRRAERERRKKEETKKKQSPLKFIVKV